MEVWQKFDPHNSVQVITPINSLKMRCAYINQKTSFTQSLTEDVTIVVPINNYSGL